MDNLKIEEGFNCKQEEQLQMLLLYTPITESSVFWMSTEKEQQ